MEEGSDEGIRRRATPLTAVGILNVKLPWSDLTNRGTTKSEGILFGGWQRVKGKIPTGLCSFQKRPTIRLSALVGTPGGWSLPANRFRRNLSYQFAARSDWLAGNPLLAAAGLGLEVRSIRAH